MLRNGAEKSFPLAFIYPEFAARGFDSKEQFVEHLRIDSKKYPSSTAETEIEI